MARRRKVQHSPLWKERTQRGLNQGTVAHAIRCDTSMICNMERGRRLTGKAFPRLAEFYDRDLDHLRAAMRHWEVTSIPPKQSRRQCLMSRGTPRRPIRLEYHSKGTRRTARVMIVSSEA